jgi:hypothetical protein
MQHHLLNPRLVILQFEHGGSPPGHDRAGIESTGALVGILALLLSPMGWIHAIVKLRIHLLAIDTVHCMCF